MEAKNNLFKLLLIGIKPLNQAKGAGTELLTEIKRYAAANQKFANTTWADDSRIDFFTAKNYSLFSNVHALFRKAIGATKV